MMRKLSNVIVFLLTIVMVAGIIQFTGLKASAYSSPGNVSVSAVPAKANELLSKLGGDGAYFTVNKSYCKSPREKGHACDNCFTSYIVNTSWFKSIFGSVSTSQFPQQYYPSGSPGSAAGWSCHGFANFAMWYIFSQSSSDQVTSKKVGVYSLTKANFDSYVWPGDVIRTSKGHSMLVLSWNSDGYTVIDSNYSGANCQVHIGLRYYDSSTTFAVSRATNAVDLPQQTFNPIIYDDKNTVAIGDQITFWYSGLTECSKVEFCFVRNGEVYYSIDSTSSTYYTTHFNSPGTYQVFVRGYYDNHWYNSEKITVNVFDPIIYDDKNEVTMYENITFKYSGLTPCSKVKFEFYKDGVNYYSQDSTDSTTFTTYFYNPGTYYVDVAGYFDGYWCRSAKIKVTVTKPVIGNDKNEVCIGEDITFTYSGLKDCSQTLLCFYKEGANYYSSDSTSVTAFTTQFDTPGIYQVDVAGCMNGNWIRSDKIQVIVSAHHFSEWQSINEQQHQRVCNRNVNHRETSNHTWNVDRVILSPTCSAEGVKTIFCSVCGATREEPIEKTPHNDSDGNGRCDWCSVLMNEENTEPNCVCGKYHTGPFAKFIIFFHRIIDLFRNQFRFA